MGDDDYRLADLVGDDLVEAIKLGGFNLNKAHALKNLSALGFRERAARPGRDAEYHGLQIAFEALAKKLNAEAARIPIRHAVGSIPIGTMMLGLLRVGQYQSLSQRILERRQELSDAIWHGDGPSAGTIAKYERQLCLEFAGALVEASVNPPELSDRLDPGLMKPDAPPDDLTRVWQENRFYVDARRVIYKAHIRMRLRANRDGASVYPVWHEYYNDPRPGVITTRDPDRARIIEQRDVPTGGHVTYLQTLTPMNFGETRVVELTAEVHSGIPARPRVQGEFVESDGFEPSVIQVAFDLAELPTDVYWFRSGEGHSNYEKPVGTQLQVRSDGYVEKSFSDVKKGEVFGIRWSWPEIKY